MTDDSAFPTSVFAAYDRDVWQHQYTITLHVATIAGGVPTDPKKAEGWLRSKMEARDDQIRRMVAETMTEREITADEAAEEVARNQHLNGFRRDDSGLYISGHQAKAAIKEAANIRWPKERWGPTRKGTRSFFAEHVQVPERRIYLGVDDGSDRVDIEQRFVHTWRGSGIQYEEVVEDVELSFTVETDHKFTDQQWAELWLTGERQGIGASRSLGYGKYTVVKWEPID